jgi:hypothetical protein
VSSSSANVPGVVFTPPDLALEVAGELSGDLQRGAPGFRVLDPACGDGALLAAALEHHGRDAAYARSSLFGIELDPELAERARARLCRLAGLPRGTELDEQIVCADALAPPHAWPAKTHVLANPPWVSFSGRQSAGVTGHGSDSDPRRDPGRDPGGWPSLHGAFLERIARHVQAERTSARLILPAQVTELERYGPLRRSVTQLVRLAEPPRELGEDRFTDVIGPVVVLALRPGRGSGDGSEAPWSAMSPTAEVLHAELSHLPRLDRRSFADPGVHTGNAARELVFDAPGPGRAPLRVGRDLAPFKLGTPSRYLRVDLEPSGTRSSGTTSNGRRFRIAPLERYEGFPVLVRQTANRPLAALHVEPTFFRNSLLAAREVPGLDPAFVVGVLNGPVATAWHRARWRDARQKAFPQVKVAHLASQPFPIATRAEQPELHDELAARVRALPKKEGAAFDRERCAVESLALASFALSQVAREAVLALC